MKPWTDLRALAVAIQQTRSRAEAAALVATWRAPRTLEPRGVDFLDEETDESEAMPVRAKQLPLKPPPPRPMTPAEHGAAGRELLKAIERAVKP